MNRILIPVAGLALTVTAAQAQWTTENYTLSQGWNAIYALNDCSHVALNELLVAYPSVTKVWRWVPTDLTSQFIASPDAPVAGQEWRTWVRGEPENTTMTALLPSYGYLVYTTAPVTLNLTGRAILPKLEWRSSGANLVGFPAQSAPAPKFGGTASGYFAPLAASGYSPVTTQIYHYVGGEIGTANPARIAAPTTASLVRGKACWVNLAIHSDFTAPLKVQLDSGSAMDFGTRGGQQRLMVTNRSASTLTVTITPTASAAAPAGQPVVAGTVPLRRRVWNTADSSFAFVPVTAPLTATLAAGASTDWTLVADRAAMTGAIGAQYATVLRVTDGSFSDITVPVSAEKAGFGGLWVGEATVTGVQNQLQRFQRNADGTNFVDTDGKYVLLSSENTKTATAQPFTLRLIIHVDAAGAARLLSNVYYGVLDDTQSTEGFTVRQNLLKPANIDRAVRLSATHLPLDIDLPFTGSFAPGGQNNVTVSLPHTDPVNPFLHTFHPDHDNLDARFSTTLLPAGIESHTVSRAMTLTLDAAGLPGDPHWGSRTLSGTFAETVTGLHRNSIAVEGRFEIRRVSENTTLAR